LAKTAMALADAHPDVLSCKVLDKAQCEERGMGAFLGVAAASDEPLAFIHLTYTPRHRDAGAPVLALVGKGLTFDSGGYNIKAGAGSMIEMVRRVLSGCGPFFGWGGVRMPRATFVGGFKFSLRLPISPFFAVVR
jgi:leucyl aminopeptidase